MSAERSAREMVLERFPNAVVEDDGQRVYVMAQREIVEKCPHCRQTWKHKVPDYSGNGVLGAGGDEFRAWEDAARGLRPKPPPSCGADVY